jgi:glycosyltransferase involved in cell wall biosynthesis
VEISAAEPDVHSDPSDGSERPATVSVIIPSWRGNVRRVCNSLRAQTFRDYTVRVVSGVSPAARARNLAAAEARSSLLLFIDDDAYFGHERVLETLVGTLGADPTLGAVGPSKLVPPDATWLQRRIAAETPRWVYPILTADAESNPPLDRYGFSGISTTCVLVPRAVFEQIGGFDERLTTAEDTDFFYRLRRAGYRLVIPRDCWVYHDPPAGLSTLLRKSCQYGRNHALEARKWPERHMDILPLDRWYGRLLLLLSPLFFPLSLFVNVYFDPVRRLELGFLPLKALSTYATLYGYAWEWFRSAR